MPNRALKLHLTDTAVTPAVFDTGRFDNANRRRLSGPGLRAFLNIADHWQLSEAERLRILGLPGRSTYHGWVAKARMNKDLTLSVDNLLRISAVLGVYKGLESIFRTDAERLEWLRGPHAAPTFGGQAPMALLTNGTQDGIMLVRRYLDAWRSGPFAAPNAADDSAPLSDSDIIFA